MRNITCSIISIITVTVILQQCFIGDCQKVGVKKNQQMDHKHDLISCDHPSHKHDHDHAGHSGHDHSGHNHDSHKAGSAGKTNTRPLRSTSFEFKVPRSLFPPTNLGGYKVDSKLTASNYSEHLQ